MKVYFDGEEQNTEKMMPLRKGGEKKSLILGLTTLMISAGKLLLVGLQLLRIKLESRVLWLVWRALLGILNIGERVMSIAHQPNSKRR